MAVTVRLVDNEGVTWDEFVVETVTATIRVPLPPALSLMLAVDESPEPWLKTAVFERERRAGDGVWIYRLRSHV